MGDTLKVENRKETGSSRMRRLRETGQVPAVLYGHGLDSVNLTVQWRELDAVLKHGGHVVQLTGDVNDSALIKAVQWDHVAQSCLHVDLARVSADEKVEVTIEVVLKGTAEGAAAGGVVNHVLHEVEIECPANAIPERLELNISGLELNGALRASDLVLPAGATLSIPPETTLVTCALPVEEEETAGEAAEPEVIEKGKKEEAEGDD